MAAVIIILLSRLTFEETEARELKQLAQGHTGREWQSLKEANANFGTCSNITKNVWESKLSLQCEATCQIRKPESLLGVAPGCGLT